MRRHCVRTRASCDREGPPLIDRWAVDEGVGLEDGPSRLHAALKDGSMLSGGCEGGRCGEPIDPDRLPVVNQDAFGTQVAKPGVPLSQQVARPMAVSRYVETTAIDLSNADVGPGEATVEIQTELESFRGCGRRQDCGLLFGWQGL